MCAFCGAHFYCISMEIIPPLIILSSEISPLYVTVTLVPASISLRPDGFFLNENS